jgi:diguanylate cyclase (GGDEF)-like protein
VLGMLCTQALRPSIREKQQVPDPRFPRPLSRQLARLAETRPPIAWTAALLYLCAGCACLVAVVFPVSPQEPVRIDFVVGSLGCLVGTLLWLWGARLRPVVLQAVMLLGALITSFIVANAKTSGGVMLTAFAYPWMAVYVAHFFSRRAIFMQALLISISFGAALLLDGLPSMTIDWVIVSGTVWSTGFVLGRLSENLRHQADTDQLTGLLNRSGFQSAAIRERAIADRTGAPLTVAVLDLDGFKRINDGFGHAAGDRLLAELGRAWRGRLRAGDILGRHGGDEFVLLLPATSLGEAHSVLEHLLVPELDVRWSVGLSEWPSGEELAECVARADRDLYGVKEAQRRVAGAGESTGRLGAGLGQPVAST